MKKELLDFVIKIIAIVIGISLIGWMLFLLGVPLPHYYSQTDTFYSHTVYYLFLLNGEPGLKIPRFTGLFLEPGHLGTIGCFLLYINRFNLRRWENIIFLMAVLLSLSLAAYGLLIIGAFLFVFITYKRHRFEYISVFIFFVICSALIFINLNEGNNAVYELIIKRLEYDGDNIAGNNRYSWMFEDRYDKFIKTNDKFLGIGRQTMENGVPKFWIQGSAGWKRYILTHGIIGTIIVLLFYFFYLKKYETKQGWGLFILFVIANIIRDYPLNELWLYLYLLAIPIYEVEHKKLVSKTI